MKQKKAASWKINAKQKKLKRKIAFQSSASAMERRHGGQNNEIRNLIKKQENPKKNNGVQNL